MLFPLFGTLAWQRLIQAQQSRALIQTCFCEIRILQSDISFKNLSVKGFYKRSKHFPSVDRFNNSQNFFSYLIRKLMCTLYMKKIRTLKSVADNFYQSKSLQSTKLAVKARNQYGMGRVNKEIWDKISFRLGIEPTGNIVYKTVMPLQTFSFGHFRTHWHDLKLYFNG